MGHVTIHQPCRVAAGSCSCLLLFASPSSRLECCLWRVKVESFPLLLAPQAPSSIETEPTRRSNTSRRPTSTAASWCTGRRRPPPTCRSSTSTPSPVRRQPSSFTFVQRIVDQVVHTVQTHPSLYLLLHINANTLISQSDGSSSVLCCCCYSGCFFTFIAPQHPEFTSIFFMPPGLPESLSVYFTGKQMILRLQFKQKDGEKLFVCLFVCSLFWPHPAQTLFFLHSPALLSSLLILSLLAPPLMAAAKIFVFPSLPSTTFSSPSIFLLLLLLLLTL